MKNVVFDLGGVVVDWNPQRIVNEYPGDPLLPEVLFKKGFFQEFWSEFDRGMVTQAEMVREMEMFAERPYAECWDFIEFIKHSLRDIPKTVALIKGLSAEGYKLYCLSNMSNEFYDYLKGREFFRYFDGQIISAFEKLIKPDEAIYRVLVEKYGVQPEESLYIDDLEKNIVTARQLGFHTVHFADHERGYRCIDEKLGRAR